MTKDDRDIENIGKFIIILLILGSTWFTYYGINLKLNVIMENTNNELIDSLHQEIMNIGWENDSLILKYEHNWEFEN